MIRPNFAALHGGSPARPRLDYAKREAGWRTRLDRANRRCWVLPLDQLRGLPDAEDGDAGVYFMWLGPRLVYVGESKEISYRLTRHWKLRTRTTWLALDHDQVRKGCEGGYVRAYRPPYNRTNHG